MGSKITADGDFSHEIKRRLLLARKAMANLGSILKSRDIAFLTKVHVVKTMVFPVVMYGYESWRIPGQVYRTPQAIQHCQEKKKLAKVSTAISISAIIV